MKFESVATTVSHLIAAPLDEQGFDVVRVHVTGTKTQTSLQIMAEHRDGKPMTLDDCAKLSQIIDALLEKSDTIKGPYNLEVSSPGIDRPLVRLKDYSRFVGHIAQIEVLEPQAIGRRRLKGTIEKVIENEAENPAIMITTEEGSFVLPVAQIAKAKLVLTDALLKASALPTENRHQS